MIDEQKVIQSVIYGALPSIRDGSDTQPAAGTAELIGMQFLQNEASTYETIYSPIKNFVWEEGKIK